MSLSLFGTIQKTLSFNTRYFVNMSAVVIKRDLSFLFVLGLFMATPSNVYGQSEERRQNEFNLDEDNVAIQGYDVVSYFMGAPQKGKKSIFYEYKGIVYWFNSTENLDLFKKQPKKFEPAYGGWCAFALGDSGDKVKIDPKTYKIIDGELYLFYNFYFNNTLIDWNKNEVDLKSKADMNWSKIINTP